MAAISKTGNIACTITDNANTTTYFSGASIEIPASGTGNNLYFEMPSDTNLWLGKKMVLCAWRTSENESSKLPPKFMWEFYLPSGFSGDGTKFKLYSSYRRDAGDLSETYTELSITSNNALIVFEDTGFYARNLNGASFYLYLYHSLMTYKLVIL